MIDPRSEGSETTTGAPPKRPGGHRPADAKDAVAEMAARAQEISQEAGTRMASAMKELIAAAAGLAGFAVESARDLVQFMVRRGQMTQEEADKLMKEVESAQPKRRTTTAAASAAGRKSPGGAAAPHGAASVSRKATAASTSARGAQKAAARTKSKPAAKQTAAKPGAKRAATRKASNSKPKKPAARKK